MSPIPKRLFLTSLVAAQVASPTIAAPSICDAAAMTKSGYVTGRGTGEGFDEAKRRATADVLGFFGTRVVAKETSEGDESSAAYSQRVETIVNDVAKGVEVLSECQRDDKREVVVGVKKTKMIALIASRSEARASWVANTLQELRRPAGEGRELAQLRQDLQRHTSEESRDKEVWILLDRPSASFPSMTEADRLELARLLGRASSSTTVRAEGALGERTLNALIAAKKGSGLSLSAVTSGDASLTWSCTLTSGSPIGSAVRFKASCTLRGAGFDDPAVEASGISNSQEVQERAAAAIHTAIGN